MNEIPPIYLINLDRAPDRLLHFRHRNSHLQNITRVPAIDGNSLDRPALKRSGYITDDLSYRAGALGCAMSHLKLWEMAVAEERHLTIFEDDIAVSHHFEVAAGQVLATLPSDWDIVQWGCVFNPLFLWVDLGISKARLHCYGAKRYVDEMGGKAFQAERTSVTAVKLLHSFGTQGYSISPQGARKALEYCLPLRHRFIQFPEAGVTTHDEGIDCALCGLYPNLKAFICIPQLLISCSCEPSSIR
jgi:GR25 family glycosyltransferase involved in LPS biosynthesis